MSKYDLTDIKKVGLILSPETSQRIAELRAHFRATGRKQDSLAYVVEQSVLLLHQQIFSVAQRPADAEHFKQTDSKELL